MTLNKNGYRLQQIIMSLVISPLSYFTFHLECHTAAFASNFANWSSLQIDLFINLLSGLGFLLEAQIIQKVGSFPNLSFQYLNSEM